MIQHADDSSFGMQVLSAQGPVLVEFFTPSCGPCKQLDPHLQQLARRFSNQIKVVKVNSEQSPKAAAFYGIRMAPTLIIFLNGEIKSVIQGAPPVNHLIAAIRPYL